MNGTDAVYPLANTKNDAVHWTLVLSTKPEQCRHPMAWLRA